MSALFDSRWGAKRGKRQESVRFLAENRCALLRFSALFCIFLRFFARNGQQATIFWVQSPEGVLPFGNFFDDPVNAIPNEFQFPEGLGLYTQLRK